MVENEWEEEEVAEEDEVAGEVAEDTPERGTWRRRMDEVAGADQEGEEGMVQNWEEVGDQDEVAEENGMVEEGKVGGEEEVRGEEELVGEERVAEDRVAE
ncbi:hypothetical protein CBR_g65748 [Chara braunii]|uniref:Uncharacterized protein n=1 Tax=Chara braunii TaxID=69332 RepID=A0A388MFK2_CHABU|nr:hypothetical protein CBR_g65748 [Chara braunii]|eukprot:GBG93347.1 hypothetical protein CBR_g65748 [Chara braunii]